MIKLLLTYTAKKMLKEKLYSEKEAFLKIFEYKYSFATMNRMINDSNYCCSQKCMTLLRELFPTASFADLFAPYNNFHKDPFDNICIK